MKTHVPLRDPRSRTASSSVAHVQPRMQRRHERIVWKADVGVASSDDGLAALEIVGLDHVMRLAEEREARSRAWSRESKGLGAARSRRVGRYALPEVISAPRAKKIDALGIRGSTLRAARLLDGSRDARSAMCAER